MIATTWGRAGSIAAALSLGLAVAGCGDPNAAANAAAAEEAKARAAADERRFQDKVDHDVDCLSALRWQKAALAGAGIGSLDTYTDYYRAKVNEALGTRVIVNEAPKPTLSKATLPDYLDWAYPIAVDTKFAAGTDANGDGKVSAKEHAGRGFNIVAACVLEVAESGKGPLAGKDKVARMFRIQAMQGQLKDKGT